MRYYEFCEGPDLERAHIKAQKKRAKDQLKTAKRALEIARAADLRLKLKRNQEALTKINRSR